MANFEDVIQAINNIPRAVNRAAEKGLSDAALLVVSTAKEKLGTYQPAVDVYPAWKKLKPVTVRRKYLSKSGAFHITDSGQIRINLTRAGRKYLNQHGSWGAGGNDDAPLVDTGHLRQAITVDLSKISNGVAYVGVANGNQNNTGNSPGKYAAAHEFGYAAKKIPARPFLRPAVFENQEVIKKKIEDALRDEVTSTWQ